MMLKFSSENWGMYDIHGTVCEWCQDWNGEIRLFLRHIVSKLKSVKNNTDINSLHDVDVINNYKFLSDPMLHVGRSIRYKVALNPRLGSSVFEIGPGTCSFLYMLKHLDNCKVAGIDLHSDLLRSCRQELEISTVVEGTVNAFKDIPFGDKYDYIVTMLTMFNSGWGPAAHTYWLNDCKNHLNKNGVLFIHFNKNTFHPEISSIYVDRGKRLSKYLFMLDKENI